MFCSGACACLRSNFWSGVGEVVGVGKTLPAKAHRGGLRTRMRTSVRISLKKQAKAKHKQKVRTKIRTRARARTRARTRARARTNTRIKLNYTKHNLKTSVEVEHSIKKTE